jgi:type I restriction enzyme M protein
VLREPAPAPFRQGELLAVERDSSGHIWSHVRQKWLVETPEEAVRQEYLCVLINEYGFGLDQIAEEEEVTGRGSASARADFVIWRTVQDKRDRLRPLIVVECKSDNITIQAADYAQGDNYARIVDARFVVTHNNRETKYWRVRKDRMPGYLEEVSNIPSVNASDRQIEELLSRLKLFKENEFADLLHKCHNVIRNQAHLDPAAAFDEIAKILFVKVWVERELRGKNRRQNLFTVKWLETQIGDDPVDDLFQKTKKYFRGDRIFTQDERINLRPATSRAIVGLLDAYNLSDTSEDVKGIAFERFLGRTFRGEIGQFFTPRSIVEFMIRMIEPTPDDVICDPASGSGGFLIRFFEIVREQVLRDLDCRYQQFREDLEADATLGDTERAERLRGKYEELQAEVDPEREGSHLWTLANRRIYGTDANERMARTSKMNMIMHGDGHGGVHHHNGFLNVNGIFEGRFDVILTNPPFGSNVEPESRVSAVDIAVDREDERRYRQIYGEAYEAARDRTEATEGERIAALFDLGTNAQGKPLKVKTEILFIERCLELLKPGGRLGIVLPEGIFNNPSLAYVREYCEDRAFIRAVVSLPQDTFTSSGASVKASLLFVQKFTEAEQGDFDTKKQEATAEIVARYAAEIDMETARLETAAADARRAKQPEAQKAAQKELREYLRRMEDRKRRESRALLKERWAYPVFLYEAERVGISATGEADANELYPNDNLPPGIEQTCLELYREFRANPEAFLLTAAEA